ncbi:hypothetical protein P3T73_06900 [Kiritimatiellota bacterium B12222]|nr:hypothetical protein P3T73_06900 [Kiritimatiellota bacterium B12222]
MNTDRILWGTWWMGTILVIGSWMDEVSSTIGWIGFGVSCTASFVSVVIKKYWRIPSASEEETQSEKEKNTESRNTDL